MSKRNEILAVAALLGVITLLSAAGLSIAPNSSADTAVPEGYTPIYTFDDLMAIDINSTTLGGSYILMNDIIFTDANNTDFVPIGSSYYPFTGIVDGNGYEISGMNVNISSSSSEVYAGLFGYVVGAQILNLGIVDSTITATSSTSSAYAGGIVGYATPAIISNCYNIGVISATSPTSSAYAGGIVGYADPAIISNCYNIGNISTSSNNAFAGGIVAYSGSAITMSYCYNTGDISATASHYAFAGGIAGNTWATISYCYNTGDVSASASSSNSACAGGIAGSGDAILSNCYNTGNVSAILSDYVYAGGIDGYSVSATIMNCYNTGDVSASASSSNSACAGGIVGGVGSAIIMNCYFVSGIASHNSVFENRICGNLTNPTSVLKDGGTVDQASGAKTPEQMTPSLQDAQNGNTIYYIGSGGWDFTEGGVWTIVEGENNGHPILQFTVNQSVSIGYTSTHPYLPISVVPDGYSPIYTFQDLMAINSNSVALGGSYILMNDISFTDSNNADFVPIGSSSSPFTGIFDGNGHKISGMIVNISSSSDVYAGLFGYVTEAQIKNLGVVDSTITAITTSLLSNYTANAGGIAGEAVSAIISNCYNTGNVSASVISSRNYAYAGGIVGCSDPAIILNCNNTGSVSATLSIYAYAGGIAGVANTAIISNCYNTGDVSSDEHAGGLAGFADSAIISNCNNIGGVSFSSSECVTGGIVGDVGMATITNCYNSGDVSSSICAGGIVGISSALISNCYNSGDVSVTSLSLAYAGGTVGFSLLDIISNCYNSGDVSASAAPSNSAYSGGIVGNVWAAPSEKISNCYFIAGTVSSNSVSEDRICGNLADLTSVLKDGGTGDQSSGAKTTVQMAPTLQDAQNGNSIYYIGSGGWDFTDGGVWTVVEGVNNGYPILTSLGYVGPSTASSYNVTLMSGTGYTLTPVNGSSLSVESGGSFSFIMTVDPAYEINRVANVYVNSVQLMSESGVYKISNITDNQTVTVSFDSVITSSNASSGGTSVEISGTVDLSAGASYVKIYITFSGGFTIAMASNLGPSGYFYISYSGGLQPTSYLVTAYDGIPSAGNSNIVAWSDTNNI